MNNSIAILLALALLPAPAPAAPPAPFAAFGDSVTVGYGAYSRAAMWTERLGAPVENLAVAGTTVAEQVEVIRGYDGQASAALWFSCANDLLATTPVVSYTAALSEGVRLLQAQGRRVYLGTCLKPATYAAIPGGPALQVAYSQAARDVARATGAALVDIDAIYDPQTMARDAYHPNDAGHAAIAQAFVAAIWRKVYAPLVFERNQARAVRSSNGARQQRAAISRIAGECLALDERAGASGAADTPAQDRRGTWPGWGAQRSA